MSQHIEPKLVALLMSHKESWISLWVFGIIEYNRVNARIRFTYKTWLYILQFHARILSLFPFISSHNILFMGFLMLYITGQWKETGNVSVEKRGKKKIGHSPWHQLNNMPSTCYSLIFFSLKTTKQRLFLQQ